MCKNSNSSFAACLSSLFVLIGVSIMTFFIARVVPTNAAELYIGPKARPDDIDRVTKQLGLDRPLPVQYAIYMSELLHGDLGLSLGTKRPVLTEISGRLPATLELLITGMLLAVLIGVPLGVLSARAGRVSRRTRPYGSFPSWAFRCRHFFSGWCCRSFSFVDLHLLPLAGTCELRPALHQPDHGYHRFLLARFAHHRQLGRVQGCRTSPDPAGLHAGSLPDRSDRAHDTRSMLRSAGAGLHSNGAGLWDQAMPSSPISMP